MHQKSQSSIEFVILIGFIVLFFTLFFIIIGEKTSEKYSRQNNEKIKYIAKNVQDEINLASSSTNGFNRVFEVKDSSIDFTITILENMVYVKSIDNKHSIALPVPEIQGTIKKGTNQIKKQNNTIYLN